MKYYILTLCVIVFGLYGVASANDDTKEKISELNAKIEALNEELGSLTEKLKESLSSQKISSEGEEVVTSEQTKDKGVVKEDKPVDLDQLIAAIQDIAKSQKELQDELEHLRKYVEPHTITNEEMDQVYVGEKSAHDGSVLYNYGDANGYDDSNNTYYVEPERKKPSVQFYIGGGRRSNYWDYPRYDSWDGPWAVTPPWWVRQKYYENQRRRR